MASSQTKRTDADEQSMFDDTDAVPSMTDDDEWSVSTFGSCAPISNMDCLPQLVDNLNTNVFDADDLRSIHWVDCCEVGAPNSVAGFDTTQPQHPSAMCVSEIDDESMDMLSAFETNGSTSDVSSIDFFSTAHCQANVHRDLFSKFSDDLLYEVLSFLDISSLGRIAQVSKFFKEAGSQDAAGWRNHCSRLWSTKVHVSPHAIQALQSKQAMPAYKIALQDGKCRQEISPLELCYDPETNTGTIWHFRFKEAAGPSWTSFDPWHNGGSCRRMVFLADGTIKEVSGKSKESLCIIDPFQDAPSHHQQQWEDHSNQVMISMKWRFISSPMDMPKRPRGAYIRLNIGGRDVPSYIVHKSPTGNWGFLIENCWGVFASFPLPKKNESGRSTPLRPTRMRLRRTSDGGVRWLNVEGIESESEDEETDVDDAMTSSPEGRLLSDNALPTTSRRQWREALLYNYGAVSLPEGESARAEFDRIFDSFRYPIESLGNPVL